MEKTTLQNIKKPVIKKREKKLKITALFHSDDNFIIEINSKYLLVSFMRFYC